MFASIIKSNFVKEHKITLLISATIVIIGFILLLPPFLDLVAYLGQRIPQQNIRLDYLKGCLWAVILGLTIFKWPVRSQDKRALIAIWAVKCFLMLGFMLFYEHHYQLDSFGYFAESRYNINEWKEAIFSAGPNFPVSTLIWLQNIFLLDSFHAAKVSFGMIGLIATYIFYRSVVDFLQKEKLSLLYFFTLFPSILFWSSTLGKDPLAFFGICIYCYGVIKWIRTWRLSSSVVMLLGITMGVFIRPWLGFILGLPVFIITFQGITRRNFVRKIVTQFLLIAIILFSTHKVKIFFDLKSFNELPRVANQKFVGFNSGGSATKMKLPIVVLEKVSTSGKDLPGLVSEKVITPKKDLSVRVPEKTNISVKDLSVLAPKKVDVPKKYGITGNLNKAEYRSLKDMVLFVPVGIFTALFRPLPGQVNNVFGFLAGLEGLFLLILFSLAIKRMRWRELLDPTIIWAILVILTWAVVYAFVSYNLGTICRYRLQILPIFLGLLVYLVRDKSKGIHLTP